MTQGSTQMRGDAQSGSQLGDGVGGDADDEPPQPSSGLEAAGLSIDVMFDDGDWSCVPDVEALIARVVAAVNSRSELKVENTVATLALSSDAVVARLNGTYRGKPKPTNVLSFPAAPHPANPSSGGVEFAQEPRELGDIILALETVMSEARDLGIAPQHHVQHLALHGLLHLLGYDHENDDDATIMETLETDILATLGVGDPYAGERVS